MQRLRPVSFFKLAAKRRNPARNWQLGIVLAFIAGFVNAGGFFLVGRYTSHMTGLLSEVADMSATGNLWIAVILVGFIGCFVAGSTVTTMMVLISRRFALHAQFSLPLLVEAALLSLITGLFLTMEPQLVFVIAIFCFLMGLQNALITKASTSVVRTTHVTGMVTDLGIELGRSLMLESRLQRSASLTRVVLFFLVLVSFLFGGITGAVLISQHGAIGLVPVICLLLLLTMPAIWEDLRFLRRKSRRH